MNKAILAAVLKNKKSFVLKVIRVPFFMCLAFACFFKADARDTPLPLHWETLPPLPGISGRAGAFSGVHNNVLMVAGGADFPGKKPWEGGLKKFYRHTYVLVKDSDSGSWIASEKNDLPFSVAYGAAAGTALGVVCAGGETPEGLTARVFLMQWDEARKQVQIKDLPGLPEPLSNAGMAAIGLKIYIAGGQTATGSSDKMYMLDLGAEQPVWTTLPPMPLPLSHLAMVAQSNGERPALYAIGGRSRNEKGITRFYGHTFSFDPRLNTWQQLADMQHADTKVTLAAGTAVPNGANYILYLGGDNGVLFGQLEALDNRIGNATGNQEKEKLAEEKMAILHNHPGFNQNVYLYNTITNVWTRLGSFPFKGQVTTTAVKWGEDIVVPSGEIMPGTRTPAVIKGNVENKQIFSWIDIIVLLICFVFMTLGRYFFTGKTKNTEDYFKAGKRIPKWAAAVSIFGAKLSAITFMGIPAKTYATDWTYFFLLMTIVMIMPFVARFFIPFYRRLNVTSAYEYLSSRFNESTRLLASALYILLQLGRMSIVVLLPSIALTLVTGINVNLCIILIGVISIFFTVKGGIEAVIWVEVIQVMILALGALFCLAYIPFQIHDWKGGMLVLKEAEKLKVFDFRFSFTEPTFWVVIIGGLAINLLTYGTDQTTVQRYLTTKTEKESVRSLQIGAWLTVPSTLVFFSLGTLLYLFFRENPQQVNIALNEQDNIFPWYIVSQLPAGISGLLIAGIFAASMSSTEASMNSTATLLTTDFYKKLRPGLNEKQVLFFARLITLLLGVFITCIALYMAHQGVSSLWDQFNTILGLFTGCIGGAFLLGIFTKRANGYGVMIGMTGSCAVQLLIQRYTDIHLLMYAFTGLLTCFILGYLSSLFFVLTGPRPSAGK